MVFRKWYFSLLILFISFFGYTQEQGFLLHIDQEMSRLLSEADSDNDKKITVEDSIKRPFVIVNEKGHSVNISEMYYLSNLLQELAQARQEGNDSLQVTLEMIKEAPADRISRRIKNYFWDDLTRSIDRKGLKHILKDTKATGNVQRLYVPATDSVGIIYFKRLKEEFPGLHVEILPKRITPEYVKSLNDKPGLLALKIENGEGVPFVVPGGRFNEMYGWDSYFEGVGLIIDGRVDLARSMVDNFVYQIDHYGKILNANRSYYLMRTQPPFMSSFVREVFEASEKKDKEWLQRSLSAAIKEYEEVWMQQGKRLTGNGLNRYAAEGIGMPPETEKDHFDELLLKYAEKHGLSLGEFVTTYNSGAIRDKELDQYFRHDRSVRESGHDTSWRLENRAAFLNTVDLNSLLYKYENDFEFFIENYFDGYFTAASGKSYTSGYWKEKAEVRKLLMNLFLWDDKKGSYFDYNFKKGKKTGYVSATNFYPLWVGIPSDDKAQRMLVNLLKDLKAPGGILASTKSSVAQTATGKVQRQWDYPNGWAPHQMLLWKGLLKYGYEKEAYELMYRWLYMITKNAVDYNGTIPEKYDVVKRTHKVYAEYGNVGTEFDYITTAGFGWMNASYQLGLSLLPENYLEMLNRLVPPEQVF